MNKNVSMVFVSWAEDCSRSDSIATRLGGRSFMVYSPGWGSRYLTILFKYLSQTVKTLRLLFRERPNTVFVMTPPVVACFPVWLYTKLTGATFLIDAHTGALLESVWSRFHFLHRFFSRRAIATLVTNDYLMNIVESWGAPTLLVPDVPVVFPAPRKRVMKRAFNMTLVSTFTWDEPLDIFLDAAHRLPDIDFYVTGDYKSADPELLKRAPKNVSYTGFLPGEDYVGLLVASDAILSLTLFDHTMQRGAYEAAYLGIPIITSNFGILRESFDKGTVHVDNTIDSIVSGISMMRDNIERYRGEVQQLRQEKLDRWDRVVAEIRKVTEE